MSNFFRFTPVGKNHRGTSIVYRVEEIEEGPRGPLHSSEEIIKPRPGRLGNVPRGVDRNKTPRR